MDAKRLSGLRHRVVKECKIGLRTVYRSNADAQTLREILEMYSSRHLMRIREVANALGFSRATIYRWIEIGKLEAVKILGCMRVPGDQIIGFEVFERDAVSTTGRLCDRGDERTSNAA